MGILVGRREPVSGPIGSRWPGLARRVPTRTLSEDAIRRAMIFDSAVLAEWVAGADPVTDDNQRLAYGLRGRNRLSMLHIARGDEKPSHELLFENLNYMAPFGKRPLYIPGPPIMLHPVASSPWGAEEQSR